MKTLATVLTMCMTWQLAAQLPSTDLYMLKIFNNGEKLRINTPQYLSGFNPDGYNNQPAFASPHELYITSDMYDERYTDIVSLDLLARQYRRVTATDSISEYSPTPKAIDDYISCIRVEKDGNTQSLHLYPTDHADSGRRLLPDLATIGYHEWLSDTELALYLVTTPQSMVIADIENGSVREVCTEPGRCMRVYKGEQLLYVHKVRSDVWYLKSYDLDTGGEAVIIQTLPGSEDFVILVDGTILMGSGSSIYYMHPDRDTDWQEATDLYQYGIRNITRLANSRNKLVIVNKKQ